jgi:hypothetical protein
MSNNITNNSITLPSFSDLDASRAGQQAPAHNLPSSAELSQQTASQPPAARLMPAAQGARAAAVHPGIASVLNRTGQSTSAAGAHRAAAHPHAALFRQPTSIDDARELLEALGNATHDGHVTMQEYREQADILMRHVMAFQNAQPDNPLAHQSSQAFVVSRAEGDARAGDSVDAIMARYNFPPGDMGMRRRLEDAQQQPEEDVFAFHAP